jgi:hypothetical protein
MIPLRAHAGYCANHSEISSTLSQNGNEMNIKPLGEELARELSKFEIEMISGGTQGVHNATYLGSYTWGGDYDIHSDDIP